jgi:hypothetical protein
LIFGDTGLYCKIQQSESVKRTHVHLTQQSEMKDAGG